MTQIPPQITPESRAKEVSARWSIFDLRELSAEQIRRGEELLKTKPCSILKKGNHHFIEWWIVKSGSEIYEVRRFMSFGWCGCADYFYNKSCCRHLAETFEPTCECGREISERFGQCSKCEMASAIYYKPEKESQKIQGMRI